MSTFQDPKVVASIAEIPISPDQAVTDPAARLFFVWPGAMAGREPMTQPMYAWQNRRLRVSFALPDGEAPLPIGTRVLSRGMAGVIMHEPHSLVIESAAMLGGHLLGFMVSGIPEYEYRVALDCGAEVVSNSVTADNVPPPDPNEPPAVYVDNIPHLFGSACWEYFYQVRKQAVYEASAKRRRIPGKIEADRKQARKHAEAAQAIRAALSGWLDRWGPDAAMRQDEGGQSVQEFLDLLRQPSAEAGGRAYVAVTRTDNNETMHGVKLTGERLSRDAWQLVANEARVAGGYWSRFAQLFVFPSESAARAFAGVASEVEL